MGANGRNSQHFPKSPWAVWHPPRPSPGLFGDKIWFCFFPSRKGVCHPDPWPGLPLLFGGSLELCLRAGLCWTQGGLIHPGPLLYGDGDEGLQKCCLYTPIQAPVGATCPRLKSQLPDAAFLCQSLYLLGWALRANPRLGSRVGVGWGWCTDCWLSSLCLGDELRCPLVVTEWRLWVLSPCNPHPTFGTFCPGS